MKFGSLTKKEKIEKENKELNEEIKIEQPEIKEKDKKIFGLFSGGDIIILLLLTGLFLFVYYSSLSQEASSLINNTINVKQPDINLNTQASNYNSTVNNVYNILNETMIYLNNYTNVSYVYFNYTNIYNVTNIINNLGFNTKIGSNNSYFAVENYIFNNETYPILVAYSNNTIKDVGAIKKALVIVSTNDTLATIDWYDEETKSLAIMYYDGFSLNTNKQLDVSGDIKGNNFYSNNQQGITGDFNCSNPIIKIRGGIITKYECI